MKFRTLISVIVLNGFPLSAFPTESCLELFGSPSIYQAGRVDIERLIPQRYSENPTYNEFNGLHAFDFLASFFKEKMGFDLLPTIDGAVVEDWIVKPLGKRRKIEVGAATSPLCADCTQVDHTSSLWEMAEGNLRQTYISSFGRHQSDRARQNKIKKKAAKVYDSMSESERLFWYSEFTGSSVEELLQPFAVVTSADGILADATQIPMSSGSVEIIITKNFPWFYPIGIMNRTRLATAWSGHVFRSIEMVLFEYHRLLAPGGKVLILVQGQGRPFLYMWNHIQLARRMGFQVSFVGENKINIQGIVLEKP